MSSTADRSQRELLLAAQAARPHDPWPRGTGHVVLALPGSREEEKAYHEPGGAFSPGVGTFGISLWVRDLDGRLITTADGIAMDGIRQRLLWAPGESIPGIETVTPFYRIHWSCTAPGRWRAEIEACPGTHRLELAVRSAGPAGGPLHALMPTSDGVLVNRRHALRLHPSPVQAFGGREDAEGWDSAVSRLDALADADGGWCWARFGLADGPVVVEVHDRQDASVPELAAIAQPAALRLDLPDQRFSDCLHAQTAHLLMGLVRDETRPGEPTNYPLTWLRDGAYVIAALARAGQIGVAKRLARRFAEHDFFGGFGAEGDNPGLALWCLDEVSMLARDPAYDAWLWPHVQRKAAWIRRMASTRTEIRNRDIHGPIVPYLLEDPAQAKDLGLVCQPAGDGLVRGRMDLHFPVLFTTGASYRGLVAAARFAGRRGDEQSASGWLELAASLRTAWNRALPGPEGLNERTAMCGLWPTGVVADRATYAGILERRWTDGHDAGGALRSVPLWTYFTFSEAHQWLRLDRPDRVWATLDWFWSHEPSPGLYAWWEGNGEENAFRRWEQVRGWTRPPHVVPHYWSAATALLMQLAMLGHDDDGVLVVGAGVPAAWLGSCCSVANLATPLGLHSWRWDGSTMTIAGPRCPVRLGAAFPAGTAVRWVGAI